MFPLAYIAGQFPLRSETFVYREVRELRRRGWTVHTFGLHAPTEQTPADLLDLRESTHVIYGDGSALGRAFAPVRHPLALARGAADAAALREPTDLRGRAKLAAQAAVGAELARTLKRLGVRHIHAHFAHAPASIALYAARAAGVPFSFTGHANDLFQRRQALGLKLARAKFVSCISRWHRELYRSVVARDDDAYPVIRCGVDTDLFMPAARPFDPSHPRVLTVCRLVEKKGVDVLIRAVAQLRARGVSAHLTIAGDGPLRAPLEALVRELSLADHVRFLGPVDGERVRALMGDSDVFALPCRVDANGDRDGIPVVLIEAMASGLPVVTGDLPAIRELVIDGQTGRVIDATGVEPLTVAMSDICSNPALAAALGSAGRRLVIEEFSLRTTIDRIELQLCRSML